MRNDLIPYYSAERADLARKAMDFLCERMHECGVTTTLMYDYGIPAVIQVLAAIDHSVEYKGRYSVDRLADLNMDGLQEAYEYNKRGSTPLPTPPAAEEPMSACAWYERRMEEYDAFRRQKQEEAEFKRMMFGW
jgi:hypothetical protein